MDNYYEKKLILDIGSDKIKYGTNNSEVQTQPNLIGCP
jgi:hypothetical protein